VPVDITVSILSSGVQRRKMLQREESGLDKVACTCNPSQVGGGDGRIEVPGQLSQKVNELGVMVTPVISTTQEVVVKRLSSKASPGKSQETLSEKQLKPKQGWGCGSSGECLPSRCKALSSTPRTTERERERERGERDTERERERERERRGGWV
jgi:hypothetical protein